MSLASPLMWRLLGSSVGWGGGSGRVRTSGLGSLEGVQALEDHRVLRKDPQHLSVLPQELIVLGHQLIQAGTHLLLLSISNSSRGEREG